MVDDVSRRSSIKDLPDRRRAFLRIGGVRNVKKL
jgi:hypothetical protein